MCQKPIQWIVSGLLLLAGMAGLTGCSPYYYKDSETGSYVPQEKYLVAMGNAFSFTAPQDGCLYIVIVQEQKVELVGCWPVLLDYKTQPRQTSATRTLQQGEEIKVNLLNPEEARVYGVPESWNGKNGSVEIYFIPTVTREKQS
jgi:hypothetical protein